VRRVKTREEQDIDQAIAYLQDEVDSVLNAGLSRLRHAIAGEWSRYYIFCSKKIMPLLCRLLGHRDLAVLRSAVMLIRELISDKRGATHLQQLAVHPGIMAQLVGLKGKRDVDILMDMLALVGSLRKHHSAHQKQQADPGMVKLAVNSLTLAHREIRLDALFYLSCLFNHNKSAQATHLSDQLLDQLFKAFVNGCDEQKDCALHVYIAMKDIKPSWQRISEHRSYPVLLKHLKARYFLPTRHRCRLAMHLLQGIQPSGTLVLLDIDETLIHVQDPHNSEDKPKINKVPKRKGRFLYVWGHQRLGPEVDPIVTPADRIFSRPTRAQNCWILQPDVWPKVFGSIHDNGYAFGFLTAAGYEYYSMHQCVLTEFGVHLNNTFGPVTYINGARKGKSQYVKELTKLYKHIIFVDNHPDHIAEASDIECVTAIHADNNDIDETHGSVWPRQLLSVLRQGADLHLASTLSAAGTDGLSGGGGATRRSEALRKKITAAKPRKMGCKASPGLFGRNKLAAWYRSGRSNFLFSP
jgi:hypothetical protein